MAVASSSSPEIIDAVLSKLQLEQHMALTHSAVYEEFGKPHPAVFLNTAKKLAVSPSHCLVFEDSVNGVRAAKAAGMLCVAVPEPVSLQEPAFQEADLTIASLVDVTWAQLASL